MVSSTKPIQAPAPGYQGLLGLKNMGNLPIEQHDSVQPMVEMTPFYYQGRRRTGNGGAAVAINAASSGNIALATPLVVPQNKTWYLLGGTMRLTIVTGQVYAASAWLSATPGAGNNIILSERVEVGQPNVAATAILGGVGVTLYAPVKAGIMLQGGDVIQYAVNWAQGAGGGALSMDVVYAEFDQ